MGEKIASLYAEIGADTTKLQKGLKDTKTGLLGAKSSLNDVVQQMTGFSLAGLTAAGAIGLVAKGIGDSVKETVAYNRQIREMTQVTGLSADEISRLVQVGDDWGIEIGQLRTALGFMNKAGITPSIDNLAKLADEYVASGDKSKWAEENVKKLGRGYQTLIPLLAKGGDALRAQTDAVNDNLIATDKSIQAARNYEVALDNWQDAVMGVKMAIGNELLPVLSSMLTPAVYEEIDGETYLVKTMGDTTQAFIRHGNVLEDVSGKYALLKGMSSEARMEAQKGYDTTSLEELGEAAGTAAGELKNVTSSLQEVTSAAIGATALSAVNKAFQDGLISQPEYEKYLREIGTGLMGMTDTGANAAVALFRLEQGYTTGKAALDPYIDSLFDLDTGLKPLPYSTQRVTGGFTSLGGAANTARLKVDDLRNSLEDIDGTHYKAWLDIYVNSELSPGEIANLTGNAEGGPVKAGVPSIVGEKGPEIFVPGMNGQILPNNMLTKGGGSPITGGGDIYANFVINAAQGMSVDAVARQVLYRLGDIGRHAQAGGGYQGV